LLEDVGVDRVGHLDKGRHVGLGDQSDGLHALLDVIVAFSGVMISRAAAPSEICEAFPAVMRPFSRNGVDRPARISMVVPGRTPESRVKTSSSCSPSAGTVMGTTWPWWRPSAFAAAARS